MTTEEINKYIHEKIMKKCWHEIRGGFIRPVTCKNQCGLLLSIAEFRQLRYVVNPDYCSDDSPRSLLKKVIEKQGTRLVSDYLLRWVDVIDDAIGATAKQIATACIEVHKHQIRI
jgi:hypothetical protein